MSKNTSIPVITIDGPGGTGKGTIGLLLARKLGWHFLDSGAVYRVLAYAAGQKGVSLEDEATLARMGSKLDLQFDIAPDSKLAKAVWEGKDVTAEIRTESCGNNASRIAVFPAVRQALIECQRSFQKPPGLVTDGRDMGTVIFPHAALKIYLEASVEERAKRRYLQLKAQGINVSLDMLCEELNQRDKRDKERTIAPLKPAPDAVIIDTTHLKVEEVLQVVMDKAHSL